MIERTFIEQGIKLVELEAMLKTQLNRAGFTKAEIVKTPLVTRIVVNVVKPGLAIGKSGANIKQLTEDIGKRFGISNPQLEIREIERPELDAAANVNKMKSLIERGFSWRSVAYRSLLDIQNAGAQGVEILMSGKLAGKGDRKKKQRISAGYMKKVGFQTELVDFAKDAAYTKAGAIGIKIKIVHPQTVFPDKFNLKERIREFKEKPVQEAATIEQTVEGEKVVETVPVVETKIEVKKEVEEKKVEVKKHSAEKAHEKKEHKVAEKKVEVKEKKIVKAKVENKDDKKA